MQNSTRLSIAPIFQAAEPTPGGRRLLLVSYHFPPGQAAGALRWQKLARHAAGWGWELDVVALHPSAISRADSGRLLELPAGTRVYGVRPPQIRVEAMERRLSGLLRSWRSWKSAPAGPSEPSALPRAAGRQESLHPGEIRWSLDPRCLARSYHAWSALQREGAWAGAAADLCHRLVEPGTHGAVVSCGPPHMVHLTGMRVAQRFGLPHVMDLRDPWSIPQRLPTDFASPLWLTLTGRYERRAVSRAALVVTNTDPVRDAMKAAHPAAPAEFLTVLNGYDEEDMVASRRDGRFVVAYAGELYLDRDPRLLFRAAGRLVRELGLRPAQFGIELIGEVQEYGGVPTLQIAEEEGVAGYVRVGRSRPRREALEFLAGASLLVSLPQDSPWAIPSKIYDYMSTDAWLLALGDLGGPIAALLRGSGADMLAPDDLAGIEAVLRRRYLQHASGVQPVRLSRELPFSRREQAEKLFSALERIVPSGPRPLAAAVS